MKRNFPPHLKQKVLNWIDSVGRLSGKGVVVDIDGETHKLRESDVREQQPEYLVVALRTPGANDKAMAVYKEMGLMSINCTAMIVAVLVTFGSVALSPFTRRTSLLLTRPAKAATVATAGVCFNSMLRTYQSIADPEANVYLDSLPAYRTTLDVLDGVALVGVGVSAVKTAMIMGMLKRAGVTVRKALNGHVGRRERAKLSYENIRSSQSGMSNKKIKKLIRTGAAPKRMTNRTISADTVTALRESVAAGLSFLSSAFDGNIRDLTIYIVTLDN